MRCQVRGVTARSPRILARVVTSQLDAAGGYAGLANEARSQRCDCSVDLCENRVENRILR